MGKQKHRLKLSHKIGHGAFGDVFKGSLDGEAVAIKTIAEAHQDSAIAQERLLREARMLQSCNHRYTSPVFRQLSINAVICTDCDVLEHNVVLCNSNIVRFKELCKLDPTKHHANGTGGKWALVIEYAKGGTLLHKVSKHMTSITKVYTNAQALQWALEIASALEYLHLRDPAVFHRDVKLSNIMLIADTDGQAKAVLTDFGLHTVADGTLRKQLKRSSLLPQPSPNSQVQHQQQPPHGQQGHASGQQHPGFNDSAYHRQSRVRRESETSRGSYPCCDNFSSESGDIYNEVHEHGIKRSFTTAGSTSPLNSVSHGTRAETAVQDEHGVSQTDHQQLSKQDTAAPGRILAANHKGAPPGRKPSFRKAAHHPGDLAAPRVSLDRQQQMAPASAAAQSSAMVAGPPWGEDLLFTSLQRWETDSRCSFATDATWESLVSTDDEGSIAIEAEMVFDMTGQTGSSLYIAPEVFHGQPYNEKADVFSFGVVLYELMARCLIMFTELPACSSDPRMADHYAAKVAQGYRPKQPKKMPPAAWELIAACWHQDPVHRPHMSEVVSVLQDLLDAERGPGSRGKSSASRPSLGQDPGAPAALAPAASSLEADSAPPLAGSAQPMAGSAPSLTSSLQIASHAAASPAQQHGSMRPADDAGQCPSSKPVSAGCSCVIC